MNRLNLPPLNFEAALAAVQTLEQRWNQGSADSAIELFSPDCEWLYLGESKQGNEQVYKALIEFWQQRLHFRLKAELWTHSFSRLALRYQAEWQHASNGRWQRSRGNSLLQLDNEGLIRELFQAENTQLINSGERRLSRSR